MPHNPNDDWAKVELFRWQYGTLPQGAGAYRPLNVSEGLIKMAEAIERGCETGDRSLMPAPFNVVEVLKFCARKLDGVRV